MPAQPNPSDPPPKAERLELRLDPELARQVKEKARRRGWSLAAVMRALLARWVDEDVVEPIEVGQQSDRAPRKKRRRKRKSK